MGTNTNSTASFPSPLTRYQYIVKRSFDIILASILLLLLFWVVLIAFFIALIETKKNGFFLQKRIGKHGKYFNIIKIRTMKDIRGFSTNVTSCDDPRITIMGRIFRVTKIDELPQLINVLVGDMSFVGPRPEVPENISFFEGTNREILSIRPGITGPATIKYRDEEKLLAKQNYPEKYNNEVILPDKILINLKYIKKYSFISDVKYIFGTVFSVF